MKATRYEDVDIIKNDTTTIVNGYMALDQNWSVLLRLYEVIAVINEVSGEGVHGKGVAKLHPGDEYDVRTGFIIASKKAELKTVKKLNSKLNDVSMEMQKAMAEIINVQSSLSHRQEALERSLNKRLNDKK